MKLSTTLLFLVMGVYAAYILYVPMPTEMASQVEFYWKTTTFKMARTVMHLESLLFGGAKIDFSVIQTGLNAMSSSFALFSPGESPVSSEDMVFDGVKVRVYQPPSGPRDNRPAFVFLHGGGLTVGSVDIYDLGTLRIAETLGNTVVVSVDYRLAPKYPFPAAFDDGLAATKWLITHAREYGVDPNRVAVAGDSAGGYLTAAIAQAVNDDGALPNLKMQVLLFPWLQNFDFATPSFQKNHYIFGRHSWIPNEIVGYTFNAYLNGILNDSLVTEIISNNHTSASFKNSAIYRKTFNHSLIPKEFRDPKFYTPPGSQDYGNEQIWNQIKDVVLDTRFSPILRKDMKGLPPAYIATCGYDPLRDDGIFYYHRLREANVPTEWVNYDEAFHGTDWFGPTPSEPGNKLFHGFIQYVSKNL